MKKCIALVFMLCITPLALSACSSEPTKEEISEQRKKEFEKKLKESKQNGKSELAKKITDMSTLDTTPHEDPPLF